MTDSNEALQADGLQAAVSAAQTKFAGFGDDGMAAVVSGRYGERAAGDRPYKEEFWR